MKLDSRNQVPDPTVGAAAPLHRSPSTGDGMMGALSRVLRGLFGKPGSGHIPSPAMTEDLSTPTESLPDEVAQMAASQAFAERRSSHVSDILVRALDALHCPVVVVGPHRGVRHVNAEARELFGDKVVGRNLALFFREPKALEAVSDVLSEGGTRTLDVKLDVPIQRQYRLVVTRLARVPGEGPHASLEFQEITLIKRSESMRSEFVANVSHELRSPLATLIGFIETMQATTEDPANVDLDAQARFLGIMEGEAQRMSRMIDDLLSLTNVELREHERPRNRVELVSLMREVVDALIARGRSREVDLNLSCPDELPMVCGDRDQLIQVFHNLITNAIKYGATGGRVDVTVDASRDGLPDGGGCIQISVRDYGEGIEAEHLPRLTERFYRIDKGRSRAMGGTGLGLAIVKHIINRHRGRFQIESTIGEGSTFTVRLPIFKDDA